MNSLSKIISFILFMVISSLVMISCGGGGGSSGSGNLTGRFIDAEVQGITYVTASGLSGLTDANGTFAYQQGDTVTFSISNIQFGTAEAAAVVTPVNFVDGAVDENDPVVTNIVRLLLSCDADLGTAGIQISTALRDAAATANTPDFTLDANTFATSQDVVDAIGLTGNALPTVNEAQTHLRNSLLSEISGNYRGTFSGGDSGTFDINIDSSGSISGTGFSNGLGQGFMVTSGSVSSNGQTMVTGAASNATFSATFIGTIDIANGTFIGTWAEVGVPANSGNFTGRK